MFTWIAYSREEKQKAKTIAMVEDPVERYRQGVAAFGRRWKDVCEQVVKE